MFHTTSAKIHYSIIKLNFITRIWSSGRDKKCYLSALGQTSWAPVDFTCWKPVSGVLLSQTEVWIGGLHSCLLGFLLSKAAVNISGLLGLSPTTRCFPKGQSSHLFSSSFSHQCFTGRRATGWGSRGMWAASSLSKLLGWDNWIGMRFN